MYAFMKGKVVECFSMTLILEINDIGYKISVPPSYPSRIPAPREDLFLHISTVVKENFFNLYGFFTHSERNLFETLINISGIGPKTALGLIGVFSPKELEEAVREGDIAQIRKVPGIGKKTAERLIMEIRNKPASLFDLKMETTPIPKDKRQIVLDAVNALINLGYKQAPAQKAIQKSLAAFKEENIELPLLISSALQNVK